MSLNKPESSLQKAAGSSGDNFERAASSFLLQSNYEQYMRNNTNNTDSAATVQSSKGNVISRPLSASGTTVTSSEDANDGLYFGSDSTFSRSSPLAVQERSQSAAPSFLSPPPGLGGLMRSQSDTASSDAFFRRPASASGGGAVRPAAKTLMDLIQEDIPADNVSPDNVDVTANPYELGGGGGQQQQRSSSRSSGSGGSSSLQSSLQQQADYGRRSASPGGPPSMSQQSSSSSSSLQRQFQQGSYVPQQQQPGASSLQQQLYRDQHQQQQLYQQQQDLGGGGGGGGRYFPNQSSPPLMEQQQQHQLNLLQQQQQQFGGAGYRQGSPDIQQQGGVYLQHSSQQLQQMQQQQLQPQQQQIFYGGGQQQQGLQSLQHSQGLQQSQPGLQGLQAHVLPNGQTVYVNAGTTSATQQPQQQGFGGGAGGGGGYTVQYQQSPHHQIVQQQMPGDQRGQYVSVVPMQGGGQQVTYWQPNGLSQQQGISSSGMMSGPGGVPVVLNSLGGPNALDSPYIGGGVRRDNKGGGRSSSHRRGSAPRGRGGDAKASAMTSPLLEEFRSTKTRDWTMRRIEGHVVEFCQDQNGSRFIQQRLEMGNVAEQQIVMQEVLPAIRRLRNDVFGNYVVQKLLDFGTPQMKADIRETLEGEMLQLSLQMYGCRVVQKALETVDEDDLPRLLREFHHNVLSCIHDQNGNHVIQKCIEVLNNRAHKAASHGDLHRAKFLSEQIDFVIDDVLVNTAALSCHPYGCRVLQRILEHCGEVRKTEILDEIKKCHKKLLDDQYGNYVIQHVLQFGRDEDRDSILQIVVDGGLLGMSRQKFASNVVEKLLKYGNGNQRRAVVREMLKVSMMCGFTCWTSLATAASHHSIVSCHSQPADDPSFPSDPADGQASVVLLMVRDAYANYVVQTTLDVVPESDEKRMLLAELNSHAEELRNYTFAKHIVAKLSSLNGGH